MEQAAAAQSDQHANLLAAISAERDAHQQQLATEWMEHRQAIEELSRQLFDLGLSQGAPSPPTETRTTFAPFETPRPLPLNLRPGHTPSPLFQTPLEHVQEHPKDGGHAYSRSSSGSSSRVESVVPSMR